MKRIQCQVKYYPSSLDTFSCHWKYRWKLCFMYVCMCVNACVWEFKYHKEKCDAVHPSILTSYIISFFWLQASPHPISFNILQYVRVLFHCTQCTAQYHKIIISHDSHSRYYILFILNRLFMPGSILFQKHLCITFCIYR